MKQDLFSVRNAEGQKFGLMMCQTKYFKFHLCACVFHLFSATFSLHSVLYLFYTFMHTIRSTIIIVT